MEKLTRLSKFLIAAILVGSGAAAYHTHGERLRHAFAGTKPAPSAAPGLAVHAESAVTASAAVPALAPAAALRPPSADGKIKVVLAAWPGHMPLVVATGGLTTQPGSAAAAEGLDLEISFVDDPVKKNKLLLEGEVHFIWSTVDELPITIGGYRSAGLNARTFLQLDWSRGGDACVADQSIRKVEDLLGRRSAMMLFSPDHTLFEFMITNSRFTPQQVESVRAATRFSADDSTFGRALFAQGKVDVTCVWEPDVTLTLESRPGAHVLFSTAEATELIADVLVGREDFLEAHRGVAEKLARVWFKGVEQAERDRPAAAQLISTAAERFKNEMGYEKTLQSLGWVKWTDLSDNVRFFGLGGAPPAFDRAYNQADSIWITYPQAEIHDRFAPITLRNDTIVRSVWEAAGKPAPREAATYEPRVAQQGEALFTKPVSINFASGSSVLDTEALSIVNSAILPQLEIARAMYIRVEGNTDSVGDREVNQRLSERRAWTIVEYLVSRGIPRARMVARGNGPSNPVASNKTADGRAQNRRTDIVFIKDKG